MPTDRHTKVFDGQHWKEVVVDAKTGRPRQAGTAVGGKWLDRLRTTCEEHLYVFSRVIMGRKYLTKTLHLPVCTFLQKIPPFRKMLLLPRRHAKTSIVAHCLPPHILIQKPESNPYFPTLPGSDCRILLAGETEARAMGNLRTIQAVFESNQLFRALWPYATYERPSSEAKKWNDKEIIIPRDTEYPDPSVRAIGVGGAITGARPNVLLKDDLISLEARNSPTVMQTAIEWHTASRALLDEYEKSTKLQSLEFIIGTRWAVYDLYQFIMDHDPTVESQIRSIIERQPDGTFEPIYPEYVSMQDVEHLKQEYGALFWLLYMNQPHNPELVDFDLDQVRFYNILGDMLEYPDDERDVFLSQKFKDGEAIGQVPRGTQVTKDIWSIYAKRGDQIRRV